MEPSQPKIASIAKLSTFRLSRLSQAPPVFASIPIASPPIAPLSDRQVDDAAADKDQQAKSHKDKNVKG
jgi:hypothetical protein